MVIMTVDVLFLLGLHENEKDEMSDNFSDFRSNFRYDSFDNYGWNISTIIKLVLDSSKKILTVVKIL